MLSQKWHHHSLRNNYIIYILLSQIRHQSYSKIVLYKLLPSKSHRCQNYSFQVYPVPEITRRNLQLISHHLFWIMYTKKRTAFLSAVSQCGNTTYFGGLRKGNNLSRNTRRNYSVYMVIWCGLSSSGCWRHFKSLASHEFVSN